MTEETAITRNVLHISNRYVLKRTENCLRHANSWHTGALRSLQYNSPTTALHKSKSVQQP